MTTQVHTQAQINFADAHTLKTNTATWFHTLQHKCRTYLTLFLENMADTSAWMDG